MKIIISMMNLLVENIYTRNIHNMLSWVLIKNANCAHNDSYILLDMWYNLSTLLEFEVLVASLLYQRGFSLHYYTQMSRGKKWHSASAQDRKDKAMVNPSSPDHPNSNPGSTITGNPPPPSTPVPPPSTATLCNTPCYENPN
jgi:hypothetical protein